jgi:hypothetical protein
MKILIGTVSKVALEHKSLAATISMAETVQ